MPTKSQQEAAEQDRVGRGGVRDPVRKQLAIDIHNAGGIQDFDKYKQYALDDLLNKKKIYPVNKKERKQIRNLVYNQWKKWSTEKYHQLIEEPFGILPTQHSIPNKPTTSHSTINKKHIPTMSAAKNSIGKRIITPLPNGLIACIVWVDTKLDNMHIVVSQDGYSIKKATKKPKQETAQQLLAKFPWSRDKNNAVVMALNAELEKIKDDSDPNEATIINVDEEVVHEFYDCNGEPSPINWTIDGDGYQYITFYLKTVKSFKQSGKGTFKKYEKYDNMAGMDIGVDDDDLFEEQTVDDVRAEMNGLRDELADQHRQQMDDNRRQLEEQRLHMEQQRAQMEQQQQQMQQQMQMQMQMIQGLVQQMMPPQPQPPAPDDAPSSNHHGGQQPVPDGAPSLAQAVAQAQAEAAAQALFRGTEPMQ